MAGILKDMKLLYVTAFARVSVKMLMRSCPLPPGTASLQGVHWLASSAAERLGPADAHGI